MLKETVEKVRRIEEPYRLKARKRNARATLVLVLFTVIAVSVLVSAVSFVEISIARMNGQLVYDIVITVLYGGGIVTFIVLTILVYREKLAPVYDDSLSDNNVFQKSIFVFYIPLAVIFVIALRWVGYSGTNGKTAFSNPKEGVVYSWISLGTWTVSLFVMFLILAGIFTFFRESQQVYAYVTTSGVPYKRNRSPFVRQVHDENTDSSYLVVDQSQ